MQQTRGDGPGPRVFQADPAEHHPGKQRHEHVGGQQQEHVALDGAVDVTEDLHGDLLARERRSGESYQLSFEGVARQQEKENQEQHHGCLNNISQGPHGTRPEEVSRPECGRIVDDDARRRLYRRRGNAGRMAGRLLELVARRFVRLCIASRWPSPSLASPLDNWLAASGNCSMIACICPRKE